MRFRVQGFSLCGVGAVCGGCGTGLRVSGRDVDRTEAGAAAGVCAGVERARAALARAGPVLEAVRRAREAIPPPIPVLEVPHITRGASAV